MQVSQDVLAVLSDASIADNAVALTAQLDRSLYTRTNKMLEAAGGKWNRKAKAHLFDSDAGDRIDQIILTGSIDIPKDEFNYFPTPPAVVARLVELAEVEANSQVLEPSAGRGAILSAFRGLAFLHAIELQADNAAALQALGWLDSVREADFLTVKPEPIYDRVVMNPPFLKQSDVRHVLHAHQFLKPGGQLTAVMSAGVTFRENALTQGFRALVENRGGHIEPLPENSFKQAGTGVNTVVAVIPA